MNRRKIQLIAGTTYSVSLPKEWIKKNNLKEKNEILIFEKNDRSLVISPHEVKQKELKEISLNVDDYVENIDQILFAIYYLGIETITLFSKTELTKDIKAKIRKTLTHMSGTEINYEDKQKIVIKVLLDKSKVDAIQVLYRISLIIESSITNMLETLDIDEIRINENEIDRLYHLMAKIVSLSLVDSNILHSSKIMNISLIPSFFLISKRLENLGDNINHLSEYIKRNKILAEQYKEILQFVKKELTRNIKYLLNPYQKVFEKISEKELKKIMGHASRIKDSIVSDYLKEGVRRLIDVNQEIVNISFYNKLIKDDQL
jgi:phosphate uptake regulator